MTKLREEMHRIIMSVRINYSMIQLDQAVDKEHSMTFRNIPEYQKIINEKKKMEKRKEIEKKEIV